jgi:hypothetical protein
MRGFPMNRLHELGEELRAVVIGRHPLVDTIIPPIVFVALRGWLGFSYAAWAALATALLIVLYRLWQRRPLTYALGGVAGVLLAWLLAQWLKRAEGFFLPGMITDLLTALACLASLALKRPLVAFTSHLARGWPLAWYWHSRVRPAYSAVTLFWTTFFALRLVFQVALWQRGALDALGLVQVLAGWPATILLLIGSYLYGLWRLRRLAGPSVEEFARGAEPPWQGQRRGF